MAPYRRYERGIRDCLWVFPVLVEFTRQPDAHLGLFWNAVSMGQLLSLPMILIGLYLLNWSRHSTPRQPSSRDSRSRRA